MNDSPLVLGNVVILNLRINLWLFVTACLLPIRSLALLCVYCSST